ncbi:unnamed protein product [Paramecium octaurelia]|uniref:Exocyst complex subunit EXOC6/Sec15 C-terminal domain-containing protein n=1 Tax=Paramecium octaurelia TaxID=43137 RepID=A0A8S1TK17_PAROT|nr:unnamed protein product [Paramecium octaurelia]
MSDSDDSVTELQEESDKAEVIQYFSTNYGKVVSNFQQYCETRNQMSSLVMKVNAFENKIDKVKKSNLYDIREISNKTNLIINLTKLQNMLLQMKNNVIHGQKAIMNIKQDKHTAAIRAIQKLDSKNLPDFVSNLQQLITNKVQVEANTKIQQWVELSKQQQIDMGQSVIQNCEQLLMVNSQFARISLFQPDLRSSIVMRQSAVGRVSMVRQSIVRQSVAPSQSRISFFQQFKQQQTSNLQVSRTSQLNQSVLDQSQQMLHESLIEPSAWEFSIDYSQLKMPQLIYENLNQRLSFYQQLKQSRIKFLQYVCGTEIRQNLNDFKNYLACILGFVLMDLELNKSFKDYEEMNQVVLENVKLIEKQIKNSFINFDLRDLLQIKKEIQLFSVALAKLHQYQLSNQINKCLNDQFLVYSNRRIEEIKKTLIKSIQTDSGVFLTLQNKEQFDQLCTILKCPQNKKMELPISQFAQDAVYQINLFIEGSITYLQSLNEYFDQNVIFYMDTLFMAICDIIKSHVQQCDNFMLLAQSTLNFNHIELSIQYYKKNIESLLQVTQTKEMECQSHFKNTRYFCEEALQNAINQKVVLPQIDWAPSAPNKGPNDYFIMLNGYYESIIGTLQLMVPQFVDSSIYLTFKYLNKLIWKQLLEAKAFNIIGLSNLEVDLQSFLKVCNQQMFPESVKEIIQFLNLFLVDVPASYLDSQKRQTNYSYLEVPKLLKIFPKYKKVIYAKLPVVRKREVDAVIKKIQENLQAF